MSLLSEAHTANISMPKKNSTSRMSVKTSVRITLPTTSVRCYLLNIPFSLHNFQSYIKVITMMFAEVKQ